MNLFSWGCRRFAARSVRAPPTSAPEQPRPRKRRGGQQGALPAHGSGSGHRAGPAAGGAGDPAEGPGVLAGLRAAPVLCKGHRTGAWALMRVTALFLARGEGIRSTQS